MNFRNASVAIATDDGTTISSHFGRARFYEVLTFANGKVIERERREKSGHHTFGAGPGDHHESHHGAGNEHRHQHMIATIIDCQAVVVRGMGQGAVEHIEQAQLVPVLTRLRTIEEVINAIDAGTLEHEPDRIHHH